MKNNQNHESQVRVAKSNVSPARATNQKGECNSRDYFSKEIKKILKEKESVFPKEIIVRFKTSKGEVVKVPATKGTVYYEKKDVLKIIRILKKQIGGKK
jgi:hypothetical protein